MDVRAQERHDTNLVNFWLIVNGKSAFSGDGTTQGQGYYSFAFRPTLEDDLNPCILTGEASARGEMTAKGSLNDGSLTVDIDFLTSSLVQSPEIKCHDANDRQAAKAFFPQGDIHPNQDLDLKGLVFAPGQTQQRLSFGATGWCTVTVTKRVKP